MYSSILSRLIENTSKPSWLVIGFLLLCGVAVGDYLTGPELSFSLFYLIPIFIFSWKISGKAGIISSFFCAAVWVTVEVMTGEDSNPFVYFWNMIIRLGFFLLPAVLLKTIEQERRLARTDSLTGAVTNRYFIDILQNEIERSKRYGNFFTVVFIDVDNFKVINDTFGHAFGDLVLQTIVGLMTKYLRKTDLIARVGGDEFAILMPETDSIAAQTAITNLTTKMSDDLTAMKYPITFSIGVLSLSASDLSADKVLGTADKMMYMVKNNGKNNVHYEIYSEQTQN